MLGPILGHTTDTTTRIWIAADGGPHRLEVEGGSTVPFRPTEAGVPEFGTAIADATGLAPDTRYRYVVRSPDGVVAARGSIHTFPLQWDRTDLLFASASCDSLHVAGDRSSPGAWDLLARRMRRGDLRFLMLLGDQVYMDEMEDLWCLPLDLDRRERRRRMAEVYHRFWSRAPVAEILANVPTYMMWDDHEIRNGWGSDPGDSPTLACRYPRSRPISARYEAFFEDARHVYWHFQHVRNPATPGVDGAAFLEQGTRRAVPFAFACGATTLLVLDNRGARDVWRRPLPVLGAEQWTALRGMLQGLDAKTDSLVVVVPLPVVSMPNRGIVQVMFGRRRDDIRLFRQGRSARLKMFPERGEPTSGASKLLVYLRALVDLAGAVLFGLGSTGRFHLKDLTDVRDNWANHLVRRERDALLRAVLAVRQHGRAVSFIGGDLHVGARMDIVERGGARVPTLITSGIGQAPSAGPVVHTVLGRHFRIARGLRARLVEHCVAHNFGLTRIRRDQDAAAITHELVHAGSHECSPI